MEIQGVDAVALQTKLKQAPSPVPKSRAVKRSQEAVRQSCMNFEPYIRSRSLTGRDNGTMIVCGVGVCRRRSVLHKGGLGRQVDKNEHSHVIVGSDKRGLPWRKSLAVEPSRRTRCLGGSVGHDASGGSWHSGWGSRRRRRETRRGGCARRRRRRRPSITARDGRGGWPSSRSRARRTIEARCRRGRLHALAFRPRMAVVLSPATRGRATTWPPRPSTRSPPAIWSMV
jgi:hypothetical protein